MAKCIGFNYIAGIDARVLILGSLPGVESLKQQQYYAKKQNSFWKIMGELVGARPELPYEKRLQCLIDRKIALWDVCAAAEREGSLDSAIQSPVANDFRAFFKRHTHIEMIGFNGQPAHKLFVSHVLQDLPPAASTLHREILPSTSPAHAGMRFDEKLSRWRKVFAPVLS